MFITDQFTSNLTEQYLDAKDLLLIYSALDGLKHPSLPWNSTKSISESPGKTNALQVASLFSNFSSIGPTMPTL
ncbi:MAG: hypothetical protein IPH96_03410 [Saprospiraceae bacterium]|nr:hypothetical protein [Saprospiraceae bacterium]